MVGLIRTSGLIRTTFWRFPSYELAQHPCKKNANGLTRFCTLTTPLSHLFYKKNANGLCRKSNLKTQLGFCYDCVLFRMRFLKKSICQKNATGLRPFAFKTQLCLAQLRLKRKRILSNCVLNATVQARLRFKTHLGKTQL